MSARSTVSVTSLASALPPDGSGMFQLISHCVRSMTVSRLRCARVLPNASAAGAVHVPVAVTGLVMPLIVSSPATVAVPSSLSCDVVGDERDRRVVVGVEELGAEDVGAELLGRADRDRLDLRGALELAVGEAGGDVAQRAAEDRNALVLDGEAEAGVNGVSGEGAGEGGVRAHGGSLRGSRVLLTCKRRRFRLRSRTVAQLISDATTSPFFLVWRPAASARAAPTSR